MGGRGTWGIHTHSELRARLLLWYLLFGEQHICLSDPQSPHLYYEEVELVWWSSKYHMGKFHMEGKRKMEPPRGPWLGVSQAPQALLGVPRIWLNNHWNYCLLRPWNLRVSYPRSSHSTLSTSYVTWDKWPNLSGLCFEAVVRFSRAGKVLSDWETHVRGSGIFW